MADKSQAPGGRKRPDPSELVARFRELTLLLYDTSVPAQTLKERVDPHLAPDIEFKDPVVQGRGRRQFELGLRGFHCAFRFDFDIFQIHVQMNDLGDGGRVLVDGVMNLRNLSFYTYPLRTQLVYDFVLDRAGSCLQIARLEEMWSLGDLLENAPFVGPIFQVTRRLNGYLLCAGFWLACHVQCP